MEHESRRENGGTDGSGPRRDIDGSGGWERLGGNVPLMACCHVRSDGSGCECESDGVGRVYGHGTTSTCSCCGGSLLCQARRGSSVRCVRGTRWMGCRTG